MMAVDIDPRLEARRMAVAEQRARSRLRRLLTILTVFAVAGAVVWTLRSPFFSIEHLVVEGSESPAVADLLAAAGVGLGTPLIEVDAASAEAALEADPGIMSARVEVEWPQTVWVEVEERLAVAWAEVDGAWSRVGIDGVALGTADSPDGNLPRLELGPDTALGSGALEFFSALDPAVAAGARAYQQDGELWAEVAGLAVRLGGPVEMGDKARAVAALVATEPEAGSVITVVAPSRPALMPPGVDPPSDSQVEPEG
jgi:cell division protein FtsQ